MNSPAAHEDPAAQRVSPSRVFMLFADERGKGVKPQEAGKETKDSALKSTQEQDESGMLLKVMGVVLAVWVGISLFLVRINLKIVKLEKEINDL